MNELYSKVLQDAITMYIQREGQVYKSGPLSDRWSTRLNDILDNIDTYQVGPKDSDLRKVLNEHMFSIMSVPNAKIEIEALNNLYYMIFGEYSPNFYLYAKQKL